MAILAGLAVVFIASHGPPEDESRSVIGNYSYWAVRIATESLLFFVTRSAIESYFKPQLSFAAITGFAVFLSHAPFVLSVTAIDIVLGYPELGMQGGGGPQPLLSALLWEMLYLADNHAALCLLLSMPRWICMQSEQPPSLLETDTPVTLLSSLDPPLNGAIIWIEAQEHYVRIMTTKESRLVLARFSDVIRELSNIGGMQVHRSHWVLESAVAAQRKEGQSLKLVLTTGDVVPVSRSFRQQVQSAFES